MARPMKPGQKEKYQELESLIEARGEWSINCSKLSREWKISERTLNGWKHRIVETKGPIDITEAGRSINNVMVFNMKRANGIIISSKSERIKLEAIRTLNQTVDSYCSFLNEFGIKNKAIIRVDGNFSLKDELVNAFKLCEIKNGNKNGAPTLEERELKEKS